MGREDLGSEVGGAGRGPPLVLLGLRLTWLCTLNLLSPVLVASMVPVGPSGAHSPPWAS